MEAVNWNMMAIKMSKQKQELKNVINVGSLPAAQLKIQPWPCSLRCLAKLEDGEGG